MKFSVAARIWVAEGLCVLLLEGGNDEAPPREGVWLLFEVA